MDAWVQVAGCPYSEEEAQLVLAGYCFGTQEVQWTELRDYRGERVPAFAATEPLPALPCFGCAPYNCLDGSEGSALEPVDLLVPAALNGRLDVEVMAGLVAVPKASAALAVQAAHGARLLRARPQRAGGSRSSGMRARRCRAARTSAAPHGALPGVVAAHVHPKHRAAVIHKLLHHKLPRLALLLDGKTKPFLSDRREVLSYSSDWAVILHDLTGQAGQFESLESFLAALARVRGTKPSSDSGFTTSCCGATLFSAGTKQSSWARKSAATAGATGPESACRAPHSRRLND